MIDEFVILHRGGATLWSHQLQATTGNPINKLIQRIFLHERLAEEQWNTGTYTLRWVLDNARDLVFVAVYAKNMPNMTYVPALLSSVRDAFTQRFTREDIAACRPVTFYGEQGGFAAEFDQILHGHEAEAFGFNSTALPTPTKEPTPTTTPTTSSVVIEDAQSDSEDDTYRPPPPTTTTATPTHPPTTPTPPILPGFSFRNKQRKPRAFKHKNSDKKSKKKKSKKEDKKIAAWQIAKGEHPDEADAPLSFAPDQDGSALQRQASVERVDVDAMSFSDDEADDSGADDSGADESSSGGGLFSYFKKLVVDSELDDEMIGPVLEQVRMNLMEKNVAAEIAGQLCESVAASLRGQKVSKFTSVKSLVKRNMEEALTRILTPKRSIKILQSVADANAEGRPYSIVFVGVNGVGKSTSLGKVTAYLKKNGLSVLIAACDTFRSGAVEQLETHATALQVPLFSQGYNSNAAGVAKAAIAQATQDGHNVVLVDTAGRMQDNEPLMRALSKLINLNNPDLVLFVGEALVGNDAVHQLTKFNSALADLSRTAEPRLIDGIILTKFDTVDSKVGAAISMTYSTGLPIMFVGTGQTYSDLRRMDAKLLIRELLR